MPWKLVRQFLPWKTIIIDQKYNVHQRQNKHLEIQPDVQIKIGSRISILCRICHHYSLANPSLPLPHLDLLADELELPEAPLSVVLVLEVGQRDLVHAALKTIGCNLGSLGSVDEGLADLTDLEHGGGLDIIPGERGELKHLPTQTKDLFMMIKSVYKF